MIRLTRLNGELLIVNSDLIKYAEASPDTVLTLVSGEKIVVSESCDEVVDLAMAYRSSLLSAAFPPAPAAPPSPESALAASGADIALSVMSARRSDFDDAAARRRRRNRDDDDNH